MQESNLIYVGDCLMRRTIAIFLVLACPMRLPRSLHLIPPSVGRNPTLPSFIGVWTDTVKYKTPPTHVLNSLRILTSLFSHSCILPIMMDLFDELENLAVSAAYEEPEEDTNNLSHATIKMWQDRFGYTYDEAATLIDATKSVTKPSKKQPMLSPAQARTIYLLKLDDTGPLSTPVKVQAAADLPRIPESYVGSSDDDENSVFVKVNGSAKVAIETWMLSQTHNFTPLFVPFGWAYKEVSSSSLYPTLGIDTTLPQFRPQDSHLLDHAPCFGQAQNQFPVWYFFYGTLADPSKLCSLLALREKPILYKASVNGGELKTWGSGRYNALIDGSDCINGWAYQVASGEQEDTLRRYETAAYEVVRCEIEMEGSNLMVQGCTFRFVGTVD